MAIKKAGKPKGALAEHCGVALSTVSRWLSDTEPKADAVMRISEFLGVDAKWLMTGEIAGSSRDLYDPGVPSGKSAPFNNAVREDPVSYGKKPVLSLEQRVEKLEAALAKMRDLMSGL